MLRLLHGGWWIGACVHEVGPLLYSLPYQVLGKGFDSGAFVTATRSDECAGRDMPKNGIAYDSRRWGYPILEQCACAACENSIHGSSAAGTKAAFDEVMAEYARDGGWVGTADAGFKGKEEGWYTGG